MAVDIFDDHKIKRLMKLPGGSDIFICWVAVLCMAMRSSKKGCLLVDSRTMASHEDLAIFADVSDEIARVAIDSFKRLGMLTEQEDGLLIVTNFEKHQNLHRINYVTEQARIRKQIQRKREKQALLELKSHKDVTRDTPVKVDIKSKIETEIEIDNNTGAEAPQKRKTEKSEPNYILILKASYSSENGTAPTIHKGQAISCAKWWASLGEEAYRAAAVAWAKSKQADGTPHPIGFFTHDAEQYVQKAKAQAGKSSVPYAIRKGTFEHDLKNLEALAKVDIEAARKRWDEQGFQKEADALGFGKRP